MKTALTAITKNLPVLLIALVLLGLATYLGYSGSWTATDTFTAFITLAGVVGVTSVAVLVTAQPNSNLYAHLVFVIALIVATAVLSGAHIFTSVQTLPLFGLIVGVGAGSAGINSQSNITSAVTKETTPLQVVGTFGTAYSNASAASVPIEPASIVATDPGNTASTL